MTRTMKKIAVIVCAFIFAICSLPAGMYRVSAATTVTPHFEFKLDGTAVNVTTAGVASTSYNTTYDGTQKTPTVSDVVFVGSDGKKSGTLAVDTDYTVTYGDNVNAGAKAGSITIKGQGTDYSGVSTSVNFKINQATPSISIIGDASITKTYDGDPVTITEGTNFTVFPSDATVKISYSNLKTGQSAPVDAGSYTATKSVPPAPLVV